VKGEQRQINHNGCNGRNHEKDFRRKACERKGRKDIGIETEMTKEGRGGVSNTKSASREEGIRQELKIKLIWISRTIVSEDLTRKIFFSHKLP
jgi:hypothetical protein